MDLDTKKVKVREGVGPNPCEVQHCTGCKSEHCQGTKN
jgi:hypothetical protein